MLDCYDYNGTSSSGCNVSMMFGNTTANETFMDKEPEYLDPSYYSTNYRIVGTVFQGIVFIVGVLGNIMVVIVVWQTRSMHTPTNCYLVSLSLADFMVLIAAVPNEILALFLLGDEWVWGRWGCAIFIFLQYLGINASALSITAFTIERYIAICHPMKAQFICTVQRAKRIIVVVWLFACTYCTPWLVLTKTAPIYYKGYENLETCTFALSRDIYFSYYMLDLVLFYIFPLVLSCVLYSCIANILFTNDIPPGKRNGSSGLNAPDSKVSSSSSTNARVQVVKMLVVVVALFAILWFPYRFLVVYNSYASHRYMELWFLMFCKTLIFINSAINPILYNAMSIKFRKAFKRLLSCGRKARPNIPTRYTTVTTTAGMGDDAV